MKATYLIELAKIHTYLSSISIVKCNTPALSYEEESKKFSRYFHWFYYKDKEGKIDNQWPG